MTIYNHALDVQKTDVEMGFQFYLEVIRLDPRYSDPYKQIAWILSQWNRNDQKERVEEHWEQFLRFVNQKITRKFLLKEGLQKLMGDPEFKRKISISVQRRFETLEKSINIDKKETGE